MLLQRLIADSKCGFNYDYMGAAEYEFGATRFGRTTFAQAYIDGKIDAKRVRFFEKHERSIYGPYDCIVYGLKDKIAEIGEDLIITTSKEAFRTDNSKIIGWLRVGIPNRHPDIEPLLIVRNDPDAIKRVDLFFKDPIDYLEGECAAVEGVELDESWSEAKKRGWTDYEATISED